MKIFQAGMVMDLLILTLIFFNTNLNAMIALAFLFGLVCTLRVNIGFVYMSEMMPENWQAFFGTMYNIQETVMPFFCAIYYWKITTYW